MDSRLSRPEYERRMHRVIEHIDRHLDRALGLDELAGVALFSAFHFHRLFSAWMGETLGDYVRRRRVEVAAMRLAAQPRVTVINVALSVGFSSAEAFTRAFNTRFGCSPTAWRKQQVAFRRTKSNLGQADRKLDQARVESVREHDVSSTPHTEIIMNVKLIDRKSVTVAYLRHLGPYGETISQFWQQTYYPWAATNNLLDAPRYGISYDDPGITEAAQCRYDACAEVASDFVVSGGALKSTLPGGKYAAMEFKGTSTQIGDAWTALLRDWLPSSGLQLDARPCFEHYPTTSKYDAKTGTFECEICIPVMPL
jgi:AraC family transcriptional regulator